MLHLLGLLGRASARGNSSRRTIIAAIASSHGQDQLDAGVEIEALVKGGLLNNELLPIVIGMVNVGDKVEHEILVDLLALL